MAIGNSTVVKHLPHHHKVQGLVLTVTAGPNVIKLFTAVIYHHFRVVLSFCVIKQHYLGDYCRMEVNYCGICVTNVTKHNLT
jgi:hypothetical protein